MPTSERLLQAAVDQQVVVCDPRCRLVMGGMVVQALLTRISQLFDPDVSFSPLEIGMQHTPDYHFGRLCL